MNGGNTQGMNVYYAVEPPWISIRQVRMNFNQRFFR